MKLFVRIAAAALFAAALPVCPAQEKQQGPPGAPPAAKDDKPAAKADAPESAKSDGTKSTKSGAAIGEAPPDFSLKASDGKTYKLSDLKDKLVVIEWTSKDCGATRAMVKEIKGIADTYLKKGVVWLAIDSTHYRKTEENVEWIRKNDLKYPILEDFDGAVGRQYGVRKTSHFFIVNKGKLVYSGAPQARDGSRKYVPEALDAVLDNKPVPLAESSPFG